MVDDNALGEQLAVDRILFYVMDRINDDFKPYNLIPAIIEHAKEFWPWVTDTTVVVPTDRAEVVYVYPPADFDAEELYQRVASDPRWRNNPNYRTELLPVPPSRHSRPQEAVWLLRSRGWPYPTGPWIQGLTAVAAAAPIAPGAGVD